MSPAAVPAVRMVTDFVSLWLMGWNSQILGPQLIFALCTLFLEAGYCSRRDFPKSHFKFMVGKLSFHVSTFTATKKLKSEPWVLSDVGSV